MWLNPPYGKYTSDWLAKMHAHRNGIALVFARTDCGWFHDYVIKADAILFLKGRIKFVDGLGATSGNGAGSGSMLIAWGSRAVTALKRMETNGVLWNFLENRRDNSGERQSTVSTIEAELKAKDEQIAELQAMVQKNSKNPNGD